MRILDKNGDWLAEYRRDVQIACEEIARSFTIEPSTLLADVYSLPAHNHRTFLCRVTCEGGFMRIYYAKAEQNSIWFSEPIYMYRFEEARQFAEHPIRRGRIICGKKLIRKTAVDHFMTLVNAIEPINAVVQKNAIEPFNAVEQKIDSELTAIRLYENGEVIREIAFTDAERLILREDVDAELYARHLNGLHLFIERIICG